MWRKHYFLLDGISCESGSDMYTSTFERAFCLATLQRAVSVPRPKQNKRRPRIEQTTSATVRAHAATDGPRSTAGKRRSYLLSSGKRAKMLYLKQLVLFNDLQNNPGELSCYSGNMRIIYGWFSAATRECRIPFLHLCTNQLQGQLLNV